MNTRRLLLTGLLTLMVVMPAQAQLPTSLEEMQQQHVLLGDTPQGAVKNFLDACFVYMNPETRDPGREMLQYLAIPLKSDANWDRLPSNRLFAERMTDERYAHVWRSYAKGATPENGYQMDPTDWELNFERIHRHDDDDRGTQVYLRSGGADNSRVVYVKQSTRTGQWYLNIWHTLFVDIRPPVAAAAAFEPVTDVEVPEGRLPATLDELRALHQQIGAEPQGAVKAFLDAVFVYINPATRDEGRKMLEYLTLPLQGNPTWDRAPSNRLFAERMTGAAHHHIWRSYAKGATPENRYQMDPNNWELNFERTHLHDGDTRGTQVYLRSGGADASRVVYVKQDEQSGLWHINVWNTLFAGIRPPAADPVVVWEPVVDVEAPEGRLPATLDELRAQHILLGAEPQGAVKAFLNACFVYMNPETRDEGRKMIEYLALPLWGQGNWDRATASGRLFAERLTDESHRHIWRSYAQGTSPQNGYQMDPNNWELNFERTHLHDGDTRGTQVYLRSSGADMPRVVYVLKSDQTGLWHVNIWHSLFVGIRPAVDPDAEVFN